MVRFGHGEKTVDGLFFARLIYLFVYHVGTTDFPLALIHPYDAGIGVRRR